MFKVSKRVTYLNSAKPRLSSETNLFCKKVFFDKSQIFLYGFFRPDNDTFVQIMIGSLAF